MNVCFLLMHLKSKSKESILLFLFEGNYCIAEVPTDDKGSTREFFFVYTSLYYLFKIKISHGT